MEERPGAGVGATVVGVPMEVRAAGAAEATGVVGRVAVGHRVARRAEMGVEEARKADWLVQAGAEVLRRRRGARDPPSPCAGRRVHGFLRC